MHYFYIMQLESSVGAQLAFGYEGSDLKTMQRSTYGRVWEACNVMRGKIFVVVKKGVRPHHDPQPTCFWKRLAKNHTRSEPS